MAGGLMSEENIESNGHGNRIVMELTGSPYEQDGKPVDRNLLDEIDKKLLIDIYDRLGKSRKLAFNYANLAISLTFVFVFCFVLFLQADIFWSYQAASAHDSLLPPGSSPGEGGVFTNGVTDIYDWLNTSFIETSWADPICGNSVCESPAERAQFGRFGCEVDCSSYIYTTDITLSISNFFRTEAEQAASSWNLCMTSPLGLCWFEVNQVFSSLQRYDYTVQFGLPDGNWHLLLNAPFGGISGSMYYSGNQSEIQHFGGCNETQVEIDSCRKNCARLANCVKTNCEVVDEDFSINEGIVSVFLDCISRCASDPKNPAINSTCDEAIAGNKTINLFGFKCRYGNMPRFPPLSRPLPPATRIKKASPPPLKPPPPPINKGSRRRLTATSDPGLWTRLGGSDDERSIRLDTAMQRAYMAYSVDSCLTNSFADYHDQEPMRSFVEAYLGGPPSNTYDDDYPYILDAEEWVSYIADKHKDYMGQDAVDRVAEILVAAIGSVAGFSSSLQEDLYTHFHKLCTPEVLATSEDTVSCKNAAHVLPWATGTQLSTNVTVGDVVTWVWTDDDPHSISDRNSSSSNPKFGITNSYWYNSAGGERNVISRTTTCTPANLLAPVCVLEYPSSPSGTFSFSFWFSEGVVENMGDGKSFEYTSLGSGDTNSGRINFIAKAPKDEKFLRYPCSDNCAIGKLSNGRCDEECNNLACLNDGGDCACPFDSSGISSCPCPANQTHGDDGACCLGGAIGADLKFSFELNKYDISMHPDANLLLSKNSTLTRRVGFQNRVLIGLLISQERAEDSDFCKTGRFRNFSVDTCPKHPSINSTASWGFAAPFLKKSVLYNSTYADDQGERWKDANKTKTAWEIENHAANLSYTDKQKKIWKDASAYNFSSVLDLFNEEGVPYGFKPVQINGTKEKVYKYIIDINLDHDAAAQLLRYMADGVFFDSLTRSATFQLITYASYKQTFTLTKVKLTFQNGGKIAITSKIQPLRLQMYLGNNDLIRLALEITIVVFVVVAIFLEIYQFVQHWREGEFSIYITDGWNYLDIFSLFLMVYGIIAWTLIYVDSKKSTPGLRYNIYSLGPGDFFELADYSEISEAVNAFSHIDGLIRSRRRYFAIQATNILFMVLRALKMMHFQSRMGIITRTIAEATSDLVHFCFLFLIVLFCYSLYAHILLGQTLSQFRSFAMSINGMLNLLLGDTSFNSVLMQLNTWELFAATLLYWSFIFIVFLLAFNLLIAIVSDAYANVKEEMEDPETTSQEVLTMLQNSLQKMSGTLRTQKALMADLKSLDPSLGSELEPSDSFELEHDSVTQQLQQIEKRGITEEEIANVILRAIEKKRLDSAPVMDPSTLARDICKYIKGHTKKSSEKIAPKDAEQLSRVKNMIEQESAKQRALIQEENQNMIERESAKQREFIQEENRKLLEAFIKVKLN